MQIGTMYSKVIHRPESSRHLFRIRLRDRSSTIVCYSKHFHDLTDRENFVGNPYFQECFHGIGSKSKSRTQWFEFGSALIDCNLKPFSLHGNSKGKSTN